MNDEHVLPMVDISLLESVELQDRMAVARQLDRACRDVGFLYIRGDQLKPQLFAQLVETAKTYFAQDDAIKLRSYIGYSANHSGYVPIGEEQFGSGTFDLKEAYDVNYDYLEEHGRRPLLGPTLWPEMPGFKPVVQTYYQHIRMIGRKIFGAFALALNLEEHFFDAQLRHSPSQLRLIHYPFNPAAQDATGIGAHTDYECFTLLFPTAPGLQVLDKNGAWLDVPIIENTMIMNIGDMMEILSNGRYLATKHRVKRVNEERYSFPLFFSCDYDYVIRPVVEGEEPRYQPLKSGEHLYNQTAQTFSYLKKKVASGEVQLTNAVPLDSFGMNAAGESA